jgi:hypothetical protein
MCARPCWKGHTTIHRSLNLTLTKCCHGHRLARGTASTSFHRRKKFRNCYKPTQNTTPGNIQQPELKLESRTALRHHPMVSRRRRHVALDVDRCGGRGGMRWDGSIRPRLCVTVQTEPARGLFESRAAQPRRSSSAAPVCTVTHAADPPHLIPPRPPHRSTNKQIKQPASPDQPQCTS